MARRRHHVVSVLVNDMSAFEPAVADEVFGWDWSGDPATPWYRLTHCSEHAAPVRLGNFRVQVDHGFEALRRADTVLVPGWCGVRNGASAALIDGIQRAARRGARLVSFCTGSFALAEAGVLDGLGAATHWSHAEEFQERFPRVRVDPNVLFVDAGQVLTSAGVAGALDLALHIVRSDRGADVANAVARQMVVPPHRAGGQAQYIEMPIAEHPECNAELRAVLEWAGTRLDQPLSIADMAAAAHMSPRHFARRFRETVGTTPHQWLLTQRLALAQRLLESTDAPVERIATDAGFGTAAAMRVHFQRSLRTSPAAYRRTFREVG